jgi:capsular polysaccharide biosynthesis protein
MTINELWRALGRQWRIGVAVFAACTAAGMLAAVMVRPVYEATAIFQVEQLADIGGAVSWDTPHSVRPRLNVDVLERWLGQSDVLDRIAARAGMAGRLTPGELHRELLLVPAGDIGLYEVTGRNPSPEVAQRVADAAAVVLADRAAEFAALEQDTTLARLRRTLAEAHAMATAPGTPAADGSVPARVRRQAALDAATTLERQIVLLEANQRASPPKATIVQRAARPAVPVTPSRLLYAWFGVTSGLVLAIAAVLIGDGLGRPSAG